MKLHRHKGRKSRRTFEPSIPNGRRALVKQPTEVVFQGYVLFKHPGCEWFNGLPGESIFSEVFNLDETVSQCVITVYNNGTYNIEYRQDLSSFMLGEY